MHLTTAVHACTLCTQTLLLLQLHYLLQQNARDCAEEAAVFTRARTVAPRTTTTPRRASTGGMVRGHAADVQALQELVLLLRTASEEWRADNANVSTPQLASCALLCIALLHQHCAGAAIPQCVMSLNSNGVLLMVLSMCYKCDAVPCALQLRVSCQDAMRCATDIALCCMCSIMHYD
jgi:hypothetical protein